MNREIKFRAWNTRSGKFIYPHEEYLNTAWSFKIHADDYMKERDSLTAFWMDGQEGLFDDEFRIYYEVTQFTGLKDKNGKEIWEGDIIKGKFTIEEDNYDFQGEVIYEDGRFRVEQADFDLWHYDSIEVIGNVFENPELLK